MVDPVPTGVTASLCALLFVYARALDPVPPDYMDRVPGQKRGLRPSRWVSPGASSGQHNQPEPLQVGVGLRTLHWA